jgi:enoyl-[acyl-carrier protein] reductase I
MLLEGKHGLILGIANKRSIAWGIAQAVSRAGARLAVTYQGERLEENVRELAEGLNEPVILPCDVSKDGDLDALAGEVQKTLGGLDFVVHAVAFALREELDGDYMNTSREGYRVAQDISAYSLTAVTKRMVPLMEGRGGGSIVTLTYLGGERVVPHYNVMGVAKAALEMSVRYLANDLGPKGIRVNAISAGPIKTLAFAGINDGRYILKWNELNSPLKRNITQEEVGNAALYLLSDLGTATTGEVMHVDGGYHVVGMVKTSSAKQIAELLGNFEGE